MISTPTAMITFDRLKLISHVSNIEVLDDSEFVEKVDKDGVFISKKYSISVPYLLTIEIKADNELVIEFTGKILGRNYPKLISRDTIMKCFENINTLGFVRLNSEALMESQVVKCDVTTDFKSSDFKGLTNYIRSHLANFKTYSCKQIRNGNLIIENNVTSKTHKRMTIYNKHYEMNLYKSNREYMETYDITNEFDNVGRIEINLNNKKIIRDMLKIKDNSLKSVLNSEANPIREFLTEAVPPVEEFQTELSPYKDFIATAVLAYCGNDIAKVEAKIRECVTSRGTSIKTKMEPFRQKYESIISGHTVTLYTDLLEQLS